MVNLTKMGCLQTKESYSNPQESILATFRKERSMDLEFINMQVNSDMKESTSRVKSKEKEE